MQYKLHLPENYTAEQEDVTALRHLPGTAFDNTVRVYKPTHIESILRNIIGPSFDKLIAEQGVTQCSTRSS